MNTAIGKQCHTICQQFTNRLIHVEHTHHRDYMLSFTYIISTEYLSFVCDEWLAHQSSTWNRENEVCMLINTLAHSHTHTHTHTHSYSPTHTHPHTHTYPATTDRRAVDTCNYTCTCTHSKVPNTPLYWYHITHTLNTLCYHITATTVSLTLKFIFISDYKIIFLTIFTASCCCVGSKGITIIHHH